MCVPVVHIAAMKKCHLFFMEYIYSQAFTSIKQSPVLKGHPFPVLS